MMNLALWIATGVLAAVALTGGLSKTFVPREKLAKVRGGGWTADHGDTLVKTLAVPGLLLSAAVVPALVPVTALCWVALMAGAMITHARRGEFPLVALNLVYLALAAFIAWGRIWEVSA